MAQSSETWGSLVIKDTSRYNIPRVLAKFGIPRAARRVDFNTKQEAGAWSILLRMAGFQVWDIEYYVPYRLRTLSLILRKPPFSGLFNTT
jgi:hypothetical protein